jgi:hypothetical protein
MVEIVELCLFAVAVVLVFAGARSDFWFAFGVGLLAQTSLMLTFDLIAERRAVAYVAALRDAGPT